MTVLPFPERPVSTFEAGGSGPMDPTIDFRVKHLEPKFERIEASLQRLEIKLTESLSVFG